MYVHIFRFEQNDQKRLQEIKIVARLIVLDPNHNAHLISSICLLGNKLVYSGYKSIIRYKTKSPLESVWLILTNPVREPQFPLLQKRSQANCKALDVSDEVHFTKRSPKTLVPGVMYMHNILYSSPHTNSPAIFTRTEVDTAYL